LWRNLMRRSGWLLLLFLFVLGIPIAQGSDVLRVPPTILKKLKASGIAKKTVDLYYSSGTPTKVDVRIILKNVRHREKSADYRRFLGKKVIQEAKHFLSTNKYLFAIIERVYHVPREIVVSILMVETSLGRQKGKYSVLQVYTSLASLLDVNVRNIVFRQAKKRGEEVASGRFKRRVWRKAKWGWKELICLLKLGAQKRLDLLRLKGSWAGAFGMPQFVPTSYELYGVDWDVDGKVCLDEIPDAVASVAYYLQSHGWKKKMSYASALRIIKRYNHSHPYATTILSMAKALTKKKKR